MSYGSPAVGADLEVTAWAERADRFLETEAKVVLGRWRRHLRRRQFDVALPPLEDLSLRPLFISETFARAVLEAGAAGIDVGAVSMPSVVGGPGDFLVTEPPHGREWLAQAGYVEQSMPPWIDRIGLAAPRMIDPIAAALAKAAGSGLLALVLTEAELRSFEEVDVRVLQLLWHLEARLSAAGATVRIVEASRLRHEGAQLDDGTRIGAIAWWSVPRFAPRVPSFPSAAWTRRELARFVEAPNSRYLPPSEEGVFKPFDEPWTTTPRSLLGSPHPPGVFQREHARSVVELPFLAKGAIAWEPCPVELSVVGFEGEVLAAFGQCTRNAADGAFEFICPAVVVR